MLVLALLPMGFYSVGVNLSAERRQEDAALVEPPDRRVLLSLALRFGITPC